MPFVRNCNVLGYENERKGVKFKGCVQLLTGSVGSTFALNYMTVLCTCDDAPEVLINIRMT